MMRWLLAVALLAASAAALPGADARTLVAEGCVSLAGEGACLGPLSLEAPLGVLPVGCSPATANVDDPVGLHASFLACIA